MVFALFAGLLMTAGVTPAAAETAPPLLKSDTETATAGFFRLSWPDAGDGEVQLEEARDPAFADAHTIYIGADRAATLSGRSDGSYHYRLRTRDADGYGAWSAPVAVTVAHHPLSRALGFFALGAVVFLATLGLIVAGSLRARREARS